MAKILVVDDSRLSRRMLRSMLEAGGHTVVEAESGAAALETFGLLHPDLVLLDLLMEDLNGLEVLARLRAIDSSVRVLVATADIQSWTRTAALDGGAIAVINKPFDRSVVRNAVEAALGEVDHAPH